MALKYLLDTNILSNPARPAPDVEVLKKWNEHESQLATAATCWYEVWYGCLRLPPGKKRKLIEEYLDSIAGMAILPFTEEAARWWAGERARLERKGIHPDLEDGQIAAVARVHGLIVVTDNMADFKRFDVPVENWMSR